jgi:hypothetical protein
MLTLFTSSFRLFEKVKILWLNLCRSHEKVRILDIKSGGILNLLCSCMKKVRSIVHLDFSIKSASFAPSSTVSASKSAIFVWKTGRQDLQMTTISGDVRTDRSERSDRLACATLGMFDLFI